MQCGGTYLKVSLSARCSASFQNPSWHVSSFVLFICPHSHLELQPGYGETEGACELGHKARAWLEWAEVEAGRSEEQEQETHGKVH